MPVSNGRKASCFLRDAGWNPKSQAPNPNDQIPNPKLHVPVIGDNIEVPTEGPQPWMLIAEAAMGETPMILFQSVQIRMENGSDRLSFFAGCQQLCISGI